ncbi:M48 metallopeptidase family protein [Rhizobium leguminosarum]
MNLNWHLIFAPKPVLEYAVVHEMCHLPCFEKFIVLSEWAAPCRGAEDRLEV